MRLRQPAILLVFLLLFHWSVPLGDPAAFPRRAEGPADIQDEVYPYSLRDRDYLKQQLDLSHSAVAPAQMGVPFAPERPSPHRELRPAPRDGTDILYTLMSLRR